MRGIFKWLASRRLAKTREEAAYWKAKRDILVDICRQEHLRADEVSLTEAYAKHCQLDERVRALSERIQKMDQEKSQ